MSEHALTLRGEPFGARETLPAWTLMKLAKSQNSGDAMRQVAGLHDFLLGVLQEPEASRFEAYMEAHPDVTFEELETAVGGLMQIVHRPPYRAALALACWADARWWQVEGRLALAGHGQGGTGVVDGWDASRLLNVAYVLVTEQMDERRRQALDDELAADPRERRARIAALAGGEVSS